jgi:hypothetical protein
MSDLLPLRCDVKSITIDIDETLMQINITGSADLQKSIRLLCNECIDIFSPTVTEEPARVPPLSTKVDSDKWKRQTKSIISTFPDEGQGCRPTKTSSTVENLGRYREIDGIRIQSSAPRA